MMSEGLWPSALAVERVRIEGLCDDVLMPDLVDPHSHINELSRRERAGVGAGRLTGGNADGQHLPGLFAEAIHEQLQARV
jgi:hypothetical protein